MDRGREDHPPRICVRLELETFEDTAAAVDLYARIMHAIRREKERQQRNDETSGTADGKRDRD